MSAPSHYILLSGCVLHDTVCFLIISNLLSLVLIVSPTLAVWELLIRVASHLYTHELVGRLVSVDYNLQWTKKKKKKRIITPLCQTQGRYGDDSL
jgi:hypothetical protein